MPNPTASQIIEDARQDASQQLTKSLLDQAGTDNAYTDVAGNDYTFAEGVTLPPYPEANNPASGNNVDIQDSNDPADAQASETGNNVDIQDSLTVGESPVTGSNLDILDSFDPAKADRPEPSPEVTGFKIIREKRPQSKTKKREFKFSLLPAIRTDANAKFGYDTPGAQPGLPILSQMRYKTKVVPGGFPIVEGIGVEGVQITLVGAFIGKEDLILDKPDRDFSPEYWDAKGQAKYFAHTYDIARRFNEEIVQRGGEVKLVLTDDTVENFELNIEYRVVIRKMQLYVVNEERTYYQLDCLVTDYSKASDQPKPRSPTPRR